MIITIQGYQHQKHYASMRLEINEPITRELLDKIVETHRFIVGSSLHHKEIPVVIITDYSIYRKYKTHWTEAARKILLPTSADFVYTKGDIIANLAANNSIRMIHDKYSIADGKYIIKEEY